MTPQQVQETVERVVALYERERALREAGRAAELVPARRQEAVETFRRASGLRKARLELLRRCGLL